MSHSYDLMENGGVVEFASAEPRHYDRVPSIIDHLTYIAESTDESTGETVYTRKRLTPTEKELYRVLRYRAGNSACWRDTLDLASHVGCSPNTITEAKKALSMPFEQLEGNSLIDIQEKRVPTIRDGKCINKRSVHCITIRSIWAYNNAFMDSLTEANRKRAVQKEYNEARKDIGEEPIPVDPEISFPKRKQIIDSSEAELAIEKMGQPGPVEIVHNLGGHRKKNTSPKAHRKKNMSALEGPSQICDVNIDNRNKDHCLKTETTANAVARCLLTTSDVDECFVSEASSHDWLQQFGLKAKTIRQVLHENTIDQLLLAAAYVKNAVEKQNISSITGYFLLTLKNRWYMPKLS